MAIFGKIASLTSKATPGAAPIGFGSLFRKGIYDSARSSFKGLSNIPKSLLGSEMFGLTALLPGKLGGIKYALPLVGIGAYKLGKTAYNTIGGGYSPYSTTNENVSYDGLPSVFGPGNSEGYDRTPMQFGSFRRSYLDYNATGSLALALARRR